MVRVIREPTELESHSFKVGLGGGARNAIEKSREDDGEDGVTIMAGSFDFSVTRGRERSGNSARWSLGD